MFLDHAFCSIQLKINVSIHIQRDQPPLNQQLHHVNLELSGLSFSHFHTSRHNFCYHNKHFSTYCKFYIQRLVNQSTENDRRKV